MPPSNASNGRAWGNASQVIGRTIATTLSGIEQEVSRRTYRASNELRNASLLVLRGTRTGKIYRVPNTQQTYRASAPGETPAVRTGMFRLSWGTHVHVEKSGKKYRAVAAIESKLKVNGYLLGDILENGAGKILPRPYKQKVIDKAMPKIKSIYKQSY